VSAYAGAAYNAKAHLITANNIATSTKPTTIINIPSCIPIYSFPKILDVLRDGVKRAAFKSYLVHFASRASEQAAQKKPHFVRYRTGL
jgi:hypothetical protein